MSCQKLKLNQKQDLSDKITVKLYKLPKFEVKVENPSYVAASQDGFTIKVNAK